jgi:hypothetical protein
MQMQPTIQQENGNKKIARAFISLLSLVVEYYAISNFFTQFKVRDHFCAGFSPLEEAFNVAKNDFHLTGKELGQVKNLLIKYFPKLLSE